MNQNQIDNKITEQERLGREQFNHICQRERWCRVHKFSKNKMARWDVSFFENNQPVIGDIKKRRYECTTFNDWYFEVEKAEALIELAKQYGENTKIGYIHLFEDNIMWVWTFTKEQIEKLEAKMVQVQKNDWSNELVWKKVYCLNSAQATRKEEINLNNSIFKKH
jgi:hypothetical protein